MEEFAGINRIFITKAVMGGGKSIGLYESLSGILENYRVVIAVPSIALTEEAKDIAISKGISEQTISLISSKPAATSKGKAKQPVPIQIRAALKDEGTSLIILTHAALKMFDWRAVKSRPTQLYIDEHIGGLVEFKQVNELSSKDRAEVRPSDIERIYNELSSICSKAEVQLMDDQNEYILNPKQKKEAERLGVITGIKSPMVSGIAQALADNYRVFVAKESPIDWFAYSIFDAATMVKSFARITLLTADTVSLLEMEVLEKSGIKLKTDDEHVPQTGIGVIGKVGFEDDIEIDEGVVTLDNVFGGVFKDIFGGNAKYEIMKYKKLQSYLNIKNLHITNYLSSGGLSKKKLNSQFIKNIDLKTKSVSWAELSDAEQLNYHTEETATLFEIVLEDILNKVNGEDCVLLTNLEQRELVGELRNTEKWKRLLANVHLLKSNSHGLNAFKGYNHAIALYSSNLNPILKKYGLSGIAQLTGIDKNIIANLYLNSSCNTVCAQSLGRISIRNYEDVGRPINFYICSKVNLDWLLEHEFKDTLEENITDCPINFKFLKEARQAAKEDSSYKKICAIVNYLKEGLTHHKIAEEMSKQGWPMSTKTVQRSKVKAIKMGLLQSD